MGARYRTLALAAALALLAVGPYLPSLRAELVWDDRKLIEQEARFHSPDYLREVWTNDFFSDVEDSFRYGYYRPLVSLGYYATWRVWGDDPFPYHLTNLVFHALAVVLLFLIAIRALGVPPGWAAAGAALFAVHPVHVENVAWVAGRTDVQCALFLALSILAGAEAVRRGGRPWILWIGVGLAQAAALLSKEMAAVWLLAVVAFALAAPDREVRRRWRLVAVAVAVATGLVVVARVAAGVSPPVRQWNLTQWPRVVLAALAGLGIDAGRLLWPAQPAPYIQNPLARSVLDPQVLAGAAILAALATALAVWRTRRPREAAVAAFLAASVVPLLNIVRIAAPDDMGLPVAERFLYIPTAALALLGILWAVRFRPRDRRILVAAVAVGIVVLTARTVRLESVWRDELTLFHTMVSRSPEAMLPHQLLGSRLGEQGRWDEAERELRTALSIAARERLRRSDTVAPRNDLAGVLVATGRVEEARRLLEGIVREGNGRGGVLYNLALADLAAGDPESARDHLEACLARNPWHRKALRAALRLAVSSGRIDEALGIAGRLESRYGRDAETCLVRAMAAGRRGEEAEAGRWLERALELEPRNREALRIAAGWRLSRREWAQACELLARMLRLDQGDRWAGLQVRRVAREIGDPLSVARWVLPILGRNVPGTPEEAAGALQSLGTGGGRGESGG